MHGSIKRNTYQEKVFFFLLKNQEFYKYENNYRQPSSSKGFQRKRPLISPWSSFLILFYFIFMIGNSFKARSFCVLTHVRQIPNPCKALFPHESNKILALPVGMALKNCLHLRKSEPYTI